MRRRRGSVYIVVLGVAMLVTVMGMGALLTTRLAGRQATNATDWEEAGTLATSAVEHAVSYLNAKAAANPAGWRSSFTSYVSGNAAAFSGTLGRGTFSWVVKDTQDGNLADDYADPIQLYGIGQVGQATRIYSVTVVPGGSGMDFLRCGAHAAGNISTSGSITLGAGPLSSNSNTSTGAQIYGNVESYTQNGGAGNIHGTLATGLTKALPADAIFNLYLAKAVAIPGFSNGGTFSPGLLTSTYNPYGSTNADGVYLINVTGGSKTLTINSSRIVGTLLVQLGNKGTLNVNGPMQWDPNRADYPILLVSCASKNATVNITGSTTWLSESVVGMDLNGNGTTTDDLAPHYHGLIHITGAGKGNDVSVSANAYIQGCLICEGDLYFSNQTSVISDPTLLSSPPIGYGAGSQLMIVPGSWVWDSPP